MCSLYVVVSDFILLLILISVNQSSTLTNVVGSTGSGMSDQYTSKEVPLVDRLFYLVYYCSLAIFSWSYFTVGHNYYITCTFYLVQCYCFRW